MHHHLFSFHSSYSPCICSDSLNSNNGVFNPISKVISKGQTLIIYLARGRGSGDKSDFLLSHLAELLGTFSSGLLMSGDFLAICPVVSTNMKDQTFDSNIFLFYKHRNSQWLAFHSLKWVKGPILAIGHCAKD